MILHINTIYEYDGKIFPEENIEYYIRSEHICSIDILNETALIKTINHSTYMVTKTRAMEIIKILESEEK